MVVRPEHVAVTLNKIVNNYWNSVALDGNPWTWLLTIFRITEYVFIYIVYLYLCVLEFWFSLLQSMGNLGWGVACPTKTNMSKTTRHGAKEKPTNERTHKPDTCKTSARHQYKTELQYKRRMAIPSETYLYTWGWPIRPKHLEQVKK
jgi:hypothetical protein